VEQGSYSETDAASIVRQILNGVKHLHEKGIAHRDLKVSFNFKSIQLISVFKPENLLCSGEGNNMIIKIADFGKGINLSGFITPFCRIIENVRWRTETRNLLWHP
jgi:serine/threonine protein kinase